jgi:hypothetical protein
VRSQANVQVAAEQLVREDLQRALQVAEGDALIDRQALHLEELRRVRRIERVAPVDAAREHPVDRRLLRLHDPDLDGRRLGPQADLLVGPADEEGVLRGPGRMFVGSVESIEVQPRMLYLGALLDLVAEPDEDVDDLPERLGQEMHVALAALGRGKRHIDALALPSLGHLRGLEGPALLVDRRLQVGLDLVRQLAHRRALVRRHLA